MTTNETQCTQLIVRFPRIASRQKEDAPMHVAELYSLWAALPSTRRLAFIIALSEEAADELIEYSATQTAHKR